MALPTSHTAASQASIPPMIFRAMMAKNKKDYFTSY